jgi:hypothetical protein
MISPLRQLYEMTVAAAMPEERRGAIYKHVVGFVEHTTFISANALLPFIVTDTSRGIVATAVIDYVSLASLTDDDPMSRPRDVVGLIENGMLKNSGAAFGGLLHLGDSRVCKLIWHLKDNLQLEEINEAIKCHTGVLSSASIEFGLDWL